MRKLFAAATLAFAVTAVAAGASAAPLDDFNRPDASDLGPGWTQRDGLSFIAANMAGGDDGALATYDGGAGLNSVSVDVSLTDDSTAYIAAVLGWGSDFSYFVKVQNNGGAGAFNTVGFYTGNNGGGEFFSLTETFVSGRITVTVNGSVASLDIDPDAGAAQHHEWDYGNAFDGGDIGLGFFGGARADNFGGEGGAVVPEPATWAMMLLGFGAMGGVIRSRRRMAVAA